MLQHHHTSGENGKSIFTTNPTQLIEAKSSLRWLVMNGLISISYAFMNNFLRSLLEAKRFWPSLLCSVVCSLAVAILWGANIGAFYPILEVTIRGKSVETWFQEQLDNQSQQLVQLETTQANLRQQLSQSTDPQAQHRLERQLDDAQSELKYATKRHDLYASAYPWVQAWVPLDPFQTILAIVVILMASTLVKHLFTVIGEALVGRVTLELARHVRQQLFQQALKLDRHQFSLRGPSNFQAQLTHTIDLLCTGTMATFGAAVREPLKLLSCLVGAAWICPRLLLMSLIVAPLVGGVLYAVTKKIRTNTRRMLSRVTNYHAVMVEALSNVQTIQAYQMESHEAARFSQATKTTSKYALRCIVLASLSKPIIELLGVGMLSTTILGGAYLVLHQQTTLFGITICAEPLSVSALLIFFGMLIGASDPLRRLSAVYSQIYSGAVAAETIYGMLDQQPTIVDSKSGLHLATPHQKLTLRGVDFGYLPNQPVLSNISLEIPFGTTVAIVGHNGSGKSTLTHLLCRFYDPLQGSIQLDGIDLRDLTLADIRSRIALVNQQTELFNDTVAYNIRYGQPTASDQQVRQAALEAQAAEFIDSALENGYDTPVGVNGQRLSGGQRQRIALARALLRDPEILILDEATSQIDMHSEQLIRQSLAKHRGQRTMIIITHREKLLELADVIYQVSDGKLVQVSAAELHESIPSKAA